MRRMLSLGAAATAVAALLAGCSSGDSSSKDESQKLMLSGPNTNIIVAIPAGWHQVINSANPVIPEMVAPINCMGANEVACATGLARIATITAKNGDEASKAVQQAITGAPGVTDVTDISKGPAKVGKRDGFLHRFSFKNPGTTLTAAVASVPSGPTAPLPDGSQEFSVVLVWVSDKPNAPKVEVIDEIVGSTLVHGGVPSS